MENKNDIRRDLCQELRGLLEQWNQLGVMIASTERDYVRLREKIGSVCNLLDSLDKVQQ